MKRTLSTLFCLAMISCADEGDDQAQLISNASATPLPFESNTLLDLLTLDSASCYTDSTALVPGFTVYQDAQSFKAGYLAARPGAAQVPTVDFANYVVVASVVGQEGGCGAKVELLSATNQSEQVDVEQRTSNAGCVTPTTGLSYAFTFARVNRLEKPYEIVDVSEASGACPATP